MKKIGGAKGQVGGGQQGEVRLNGNSAAVGGVLCEGDAHEEQCVCPCVCPCVCGVDFLSRLTEMRAKSAKSPFSLSPFTPPALLCLFFFHSSFLLATTLVRPREHYHGSSCPACIWVKTLQSGAIDCSYQINRVAPAAARTDPPPFIPTLSSYPCLLISSTNAPSLIPPHLFPCSRALAAVVSCKFYMIGISLFYPLSPPPAHTVSPPSYHVAY